MDNTMFPTDIAWGYSFCNREKEQKTLFNLLTGVNHVVLIAPRRYGKSSLSYQVAQSWKNNAAKRIAVGISFLSAYDEEEVASRVVKGVQKVINEIVPKTNMDALNDVMAKFSEFGIEPSLKVLGAKVGLRINFELREKDAKKLDLAAIGEMFQLMDETAQYYSWHVMFQIDEFQDLSNINRGGSIEGQIRDSIQYAKATSCVFLGSNRHMLEQMFSDKARPFYNMCDTIRLERIEAIHYHKHLEDAARTKWNKNIPVDLIQSILHLTERHPYYVNCLCSKIWNQETAPTADIIIHCWKEVVSNTSPIVRNEYTGLSTSQKAIMQHLAIEPEEQITGTSFSKKVNMPVPTIRTAFKALQKKDLVYLNSDEKWANMAHAFPII